MSSKTEKEKPEKTKIIKEKAKETTKSVLMSVLSGIYLLIKIIFYPFIWAIWEFKRTWQYLSHRIVDGSEENTLNYVRSLPVFYFMFGVLGAILYAILLILQLPDLQRFFTDFGYAMSEIGIFFTWLFTSIWNGIVFVFSSMFEFGKEHATTLLIVFGILVFLIVIGTATIYYLFGFDRIVQWFRENVLTLSKLPRAIYDGLSAFYWKIVNKASDWIYGHDSFEEKEFSFYPTVVMSLISMLILVVIGVIIFAVNYSTIESPSMYLGSVLFISAALTTLLIATFNRIAFLGYKRRKSEKA